MKTLIFFLSLLWLFSCQSEVKKNYVVYLDVAHPLSANCLIEKDSCHYLYDLKVMGDYIAFIDGDGDSVLTICDKEKMNKPVFVMTRGKGKGQLANPRFCKEVFSSLGGFSLVEDHSDLYYIRQQEQKWILQKSPQRLSIENSFNYNFIQDELYAVPLWHSYPYPFYYYNSIKGYYWADPDPKIRQELGDFSKAYICNLCVHESLNKMVAAYRYTNFLTFYDLKGNPQVTVQIGDSIIKPLPDQRNRIDRDKSSLCFVDICANSNYVYAIYAGSINYLSPSYILAFSWNGNFRRAWKLDQNIRGISVSENDIVYAISSSPGKKQAILSFKLE